MRTTKRTTTACSYLENDLRQDILTNRLADCEVIPTEKELAESYGIGRNTVRRALANLVSEGLLRKVHGSGTFVVPLEERIGKPRSGNHRAMKQILFLSLSTAMSESCFRASNTFGPIYAGLNRILQQNGYNLLLTQIGMDWTPPPCLISRDVGGVIFHGHTDYDFWRKYIRPFPHIGIQYQNPALESNFVALDNYAFSSICVRHLYNLGHRRIAFLSDEIENQLSNERFAGYLRTMRELGLPIEERYCITWQRPYVNGILPDGDSGKSDYMPYLEKAFAGGVSPTAFVCADDHRALRLRSTLAEMGLNVPSDVSITGSFNDPAHFANITGVSGMLENICSEAARQLLAIIREPKQTELKTTLIRPDFYSGNTTKTVKTL